MPTFQGILTTDGAHMTGVYKGTIYTVVSSNRENKLVLHAWAVCSRRENRFRHWLAAQTGGGDDSLHQAMSC